MLSGGADSVCLLDVAASLGARVTALHVNYGLRAEADGDEQHCRNLCGSLGVSLHVEASTLPGGGNLQAQARDARYALAEARAEGVYAAAHTASDQAETVLYRLAVSPGRRAILGMEPRRGRLVRPLLEATAADTREHCRERGLEWREDVSNADPRFARTRVRAEVMPVLRGLNLAADHTIAETAALLRDEAEVLEAAVDAALERLGEITLDLAALRALPVGLARLVLRRRAESASSGAVTLSRRDADALLDLGREGGSAGLDLGRGVRAVAEYGHLRFTLDEDTPSPEAVVLAVPGTVSFGPWDIEARAGDQGEVQLDAASLPAVLTVRAWRSGDWIRPVGLGGTKSLQDLFTDRKVPRALRRSLPVVEADGEIAWVAGVAVSERFRSSEASADVVSLSARRRAV